MAAKAGFRCGHFRMYLQVMPVQVSGSFRSIMRENMSAGGKKLNEHLRCRRPIPGAGGRAAAGDLSEVCSMRQTGEEYGREGENG